MKRTSRIIAAIVLSAVLLSGCGGKAGGGNAKGPDGAASTPQAKDEKPKTVKVLRGYNAAIETFKGGEDINNNDIIKAIREKTGIDVVFELLPKDNPVQKVSMVMASGDVPDLMVISYTDKALFYRYAAQGALTPIDDYLNKYCADYKKIIPDPDIFKVVTYDGKIYGFPYYQTQRSNYGMMIRSDWLKELNQQVPKTIDELYNVLKALKDKKQISPYTLAGSGQGQFITSYEGLAGAYGLSTTVVDKGGKLEFSYVQPEMKEMLAFYRKLYDEGILDKEFGVNKGTTTKEKMIGEKAGYAQVSWWDAKTIEESLKQKGAEKTVQLIPPPVGKDGKSGFKALPPVANYYVIPKGAKEPEAAAKLMNALSTDEIFSIVNYGFKDKHYTLQNGDVKPTDEAQNIQWRVAYQLLDNEKSFNERSKIKGFFPYYEPTSKWATNKDMIDYTPDIEAYDKKFVEIRDYAQENFIKFIMGARNLNEFDKFVEEFNSMGGKAAIDAVNTWYPTYKK